MRQHQAAHAGGLLKKEHFLAGLDIGSTKVTVIIGVPKEGSIDIVGVGTAPNQGLKKGIVVNIEQTTEAIRQARDEAELMAGLKVEEVWVGVAGAHAKSFDSRGMIAVRDKEISKSDIHRVVEAAKAVAVPGDREVIHVLPREYKVDDQDGILDPIGMSGVRLEAAVHIVTAGRTAIQNLIKCTERAGLRVSGFVLEQYASSLAVLTEDERQLGVALVDIGGGNSDIVMLTQGAIAYTASIPLGGVHITNDIAVGLRTPHSSAENLKKKFGCAMASLVNPEESIEVEGVGGRRERTVMRQHLCEVIEPRAEEVLNYINNEIQKSGLTGMMGSGIVMAGGGCLLDGLTELGEFVFDMPVRKAHPQGFGGLTDVVQSPQFATAVGLLLFANHETKDKITKINRNQAGQWMTRVRDWIDSVF